MSLVAEVIVPQMFSSYAEDLGYLDDGLHHYQYFCEECDQVFASAWGKIPGSMSWYERGAYLYCPNCGYRHENKVAYTKKHVQVPNKIRLSVKVYENIVTFEAHSNTTEFRDYLKVYEGTYKEVFRFDIAKQSVLYTRYVKGYKKESFEIGNPFKLDALETSILNYFKPNCYANSGQKKELNKILKLLRESIHKKLEKHLGYKIPSMFVSPGQNYGTLLLPIYNIAYRVTFPDAPNLPIIYREMPNDIRNYWGTKMVDNFNYMENLVAQRRKYDFVTGLIHINSLPDKPIIRRILYKDHFGVCILKQSLLLCKNYDLAIRLFNGLCKLGNMGYIQDELLHFLNGMLHIYGESGIVRFVEEAKNLELRDCIRLYLQLNEVNRLAIITERIKLNELHDWMSLMHRKQTHVNLKFKVPKYIIKRLSMQKDRISFFLPNESIQLLEAGHELHNCVASYSNDMKENKKLIVLVADSKGKLAACLEIREKELVQAKLDRNKPVSSDIELNNEIIAWAKEANIKINTPDIKLPSKKEIKVGVPA